MYITMQVVEITKGSKVKYEPDKKTGVTRRSIWLTCSLRTRATKLLGSDVLILCDVVHRKNQTFSKLFNVLYVSIFISVQRCVQSPRFVNILTFGLAG
jgi:hypothetical protein